MEILFLYFHYEQLSSFSNMYFYNLLNIFTGVHSISYQLTISEFYAHNTLKDFTLSTGTENCLGTWKSILKQETYIYAHTVNI